MLNKLTEFFTWRRRLSRIIVFVLVALIGIFYYKNLLYQTTTVVVNGYSLRVLEAASDQQRQRGLSKRKRLAENQGMLFIFSQEQPLAFWMKDMQFPIDIIWLDSKKRVVHMEQNLPPCPPNGTCPAYQPNVLAQYGLETTAGFVQKHHVVLGQVINW